LSFRTIKEHLASVETALIALVQAISTTEVASVEWVISEAAFTDPSFYSRVVVMPSWLFQA
jgi:hypothetical protein